MNTSWWSKLFRTKAAGTKVVATYQTPQEGDKIILQQLIKMGADLEKPREVSNYLYVSTQEASHLAASELRNIGFEVTERTAANAASNPPNPWLVLARKTTIVNTQTVEQMRIQFEKLAVENHGDYDGWEAAAQP